MERSEALEHGEIGYDREDWSQPFANALKGVMGSVFISLFTRTVALVRKLWIVGNDILLKI